MHDSAVLEERIRPRGRGAWPAPEHSAPADEYLYQRIGRQVRQMIEEGSLGPGERLPSLRRMSETAGVSLATVTQAYLELERQGIVESRPRSGFFVRGLPGLEPALPTCRRPSAVPRRVRLGGIVESIFGATRDPSIVSLGFANPSPMLLPTEALSRVTARVVRRHRDLAMQYCFPPGLGRLRRQIAYRMGELGAPVAPEEVLTIALQSVARPGDVIAVESPCYFLVLQLIERLGMYALEVATDAERGLDVSALEAALDEGVDVKAALLVPNFSNPLGSVMPEGEKRRLVALARDRGFALIEDDIYGDLAFGSRRPRLLRSCPGGDEVLTVSSFSKVLAPGYRVGWLAAGPRHEEVAAIKQTVAGSSPTLPQLAISEFLAAGGYDRFLRRVRRTYAAQVERMRHAVVRYFPEGTRISRPQGGFVLWVELPRGTDTGELFYDALARGVSYTPGMLFSPTRKYRNHLRLSCGLPWSDAVEDAVARLGALFGEGRD